MRLSCNEKICFRLRVALRKENGIKLYNSKGEVSQDPSTLGRLVEKLPPCLNPDLPVEKRNLNALSERYIIGLNELSLLDSNKEMEPNDLYENYPIEVDFYPSDAVLQQLVMKSIQLSDEWEDELWIGFKVIN
jgi:hypothetical protein